MKRIILISLVFAVLLLMSGCARHYGMGGMGRHYMASNSQHDNSSYQNIPMYGGQTYKNTLR